MRSLSFIDNVFSEEGRSIALWLTENWNISIQPFWLILIGLLFIIGLDYLSRWVLLRVIHRIVRKTRLTWDNEFYQKKVFHTLLHLIPIGIAYLINGVLLYNYPSLSAFIARILTIVLVLVFVQLVFRVADAFTTISKDENNYTTIGIRTFSQLVKVLSIFFGIIAVIAILFDVGASKIFTVLTALAAVILLLFRDTILGFVSGVQIASTRLVKVGDWIKISKFDVEGVILEINLTTVKIENFDKTISAVPTYELISSEVKNFMPMVQENRRRIKRSLIFNMQSFKFLNEAEIDKHQQIELIKDYLTEKKQIIQPNKSTDKLNGRQLTNIGTFRAYAKNYLKQHPDVDDSETLMVRQLDPAPNGLPLEIYCFTNTSDWVDFERIQSDIFDHLTTASKDFELEILQTVVR